MDFGAVTAKKFSNGYGVSGKSAYDGVFASPIKFRAPSFSSSFGDYCEIFAGSEASLGSSIPILEVPELNERKILHDSRRSKLDYSKVFGGFGNLDTAVPYEELFAEHKKKDSFSKGALSLDKGANHSSKEDSTNSSKEIPPVGQEASLNGANKVNMSYHKVNQGSESRQKGATHIAQLHAVPAYTCLVEEVNPLKINSADKQQSSNGGVKIKDSEHSMKSVIDPSPNSAKQQSSNGGVKIKDSEHSMKSVIDPSPNSAKQQSSNGGVKFHDRSDLVHMFLNAREVNHGSDSGMKQSSNDGVKVQDSSDSINMFSDACEVSHESQGTDYIEVPTSQTVVNDLDNHHGHAVRSMEDTCQVSKSDASEVVDGADSPLYFDDMVDSNSEAAASVAALRKAIEEAQERLRIAKDLMKRKKEGFPDRMKRRFNNDSKAERKKDKFADKTMRHEETFGKMDVLPQMPSVIGKPTMKEEQVTLDLKAEEMVDAKEAARKALKKLESTIAERQDEVEHKEVDHKETVLGFNDAYNNKEILYTVEDYHLNEKNTGKNAFEKPEESHQTIIVEGPREPEAKEGKVNAGDEAGGCEKLVDEKKFRCQEHVEDTKLAQETLDYGEKDKNLKEDDDEITDNKDAPFLEQKDCERKLGEHGLPAGIEEYFNCKPDDEKKVEGSCEQEDCTRSSRDHQGYVELKEKVTEEQTESEENEASFLDLNQEIEYCCQRESSENGFGNIYVQEIPENNVDNVDEEEEFHEILTKESADGNERVQYAKEDEMELEGATCMMEENEKRNSESIEVIGVILNGPNYEVEKTEEVERTTEICPNSEPDEGGNLSKLLVADESFVSNKIPEVTSEGFSHNEQDDTMVANNASFQCEEKFDESESVQEMNEPGEKHALKTSALTQGALELNEVMNQMQYTNETVSIDSIPTNIGEPDEKAEQSQDDCLKEAENNCNPAMHVEEPSPDFVNLCEDTKEAEDALNAEIDKNRCNFSNEEILVENERNMEASQPPSMSEWESSAVNYQEIKRIHSNLNEAEDGLNAEIDENRCKSSYEEIIVDNEPNLEASQPPSMSERKSNTFSNQEIKRTLSNTKKNHHVASLTMEEKKANDTSQKVELETDHLKKIDETKDRGREREKEREKIAVERAIREARERAFAEARERAALERASAEARRKNISDGRERLGRTTGQANEKTLTERAAMEAKLKAERAAVERATAEARARALERALSEKAASEARNKSDKSFAEKSFGASKDNGTRPNFHSKSFSYGDTFDGANGDSAQRCKARFERHQRIGERVAKALAEKNARDRLVQKEQEEKNRVAEALDADVKRWSSGKEGNLRALLSTLQYILGPDSGWQPIHLTDIVNTAAVKKAYRKATLFVHPDKLQQRGASIQQKYTCEKVFDLLKEAWNRFNMEER